MPHETKEESIEWDAMHIWATVPPNPNPTHNLQYNNRVDLNIWWGWSSTRVNCWSCRRVQCPPMRIAGHNFHFLRLSSWHSLAAPYRRMTTIRNSVRVDTHYIPGDNPCHFWVPSESVTGCGSVADCFCSWSCSSWPVSPHPHPPPSNLPLLLGDLSFPLSLCLNLLLSSSLPYQPFSLWWPHTPPDMIKEFNFI